MEKFLVIAAPDGRTLLTFDVTPDGIELEYDVADLPAINTVVQDFRNPMLTLKQEK